VPHKRTTLHKLLQDLTDSEFSQEFNFALIYNSDNRRTPEQGHALINKVFGFYAKYFAKGAE